MYYWPWLSVPTFIFDQRHTDNVYELLTHWPFLFLFLFLNTPEKNIENNNFNGNMNESRVFSFNRWVTKGTHIKNGEMLLSSDFRINLGYCLFGTSKGNDQPKNFLCPPPARKSKKRDFLEEKFSIIWVLKVKLLNKWKCVQKGWGFSPNFFWEFSTV